nr:DegV family protein [Sedimentibacter sp.]
MDINLIADSCVDFNEDISDIERIPFKIIIDEEELVDSELDTTDLISKMKISRNHTKTACPSPEDFINAFKKCKETFAVTISSALSGSYNSAMLAVNIMKERFPENFVHVFDSKTASAGESLVALKVKQMIDERLDTKEIVENTNKYISKLRTFFILDSLDNLAKNGRITNFKAIIGNVLHIVPIMGEDGNGSIVLKEQVRGKKKAFSRLVDMIGEHNIDFENTILGISHCNCFEKAEKLKEEIKMRYPFKDIKIFATSGLSSVYAYDGGIVIAF